MMASSITSCRRSRPLRRPTANPRSAPSMRSSLAAAVIRGVPTALEHGCRCWSSPWSKGGYVCSELFDHTSVIQFIEKRFGSRANVTESNITPWRRAICGDLTSAFNFKNPNAAFPTLPDTSGYAPTQQIRHPDYVPVPPAVQAVPKQEPGVRPARALPYEFFVHAHTNSGKGVTFDFINTGDAGATFLVYTANSQTAPSCYTVEAGKRLQDQFPLSATNTYDFIVYGPNGFLRRFTGTAVQQHWWNDKQALPEVAEGYDVANGNLQLRLKNLGTTSCQFKVANAYAPGTVITRQVRGGDTESLYLDLRASYGWYDLSITIASDATFVRRLAGHVETGNSSMSDPALGS